MIEIEYNEARFRAAAKLYGMTEAQADEYIAHPGFGSDSVVLLSYMRFPDDTVAVEWLGRHAALYLELIPQVGGEVLFVGRPEQYLLSPGFECDQIAAIRYPSRRDFARMISSPEGMQMLPELSVLGLLESVSMMVEIALPASGSDEGFATSPEYEEAGYRDAAILYGFGDEQIEEFVAHPGFGSDSVCIVNYLRFRDEAGAAVWIEGYASAALKVSARVGGELLFMGRPEQHILAGGFDCDGVVITRYPSRRSAALMLMSRETLELHPLLEASRVERSMTVAIEMVPPATSA